MEEGEGEVGERGPVLIGSKIEAKMGVNVVLGGSCAVPLAPCRIDVQLFRSGPGV